MTDFGDRVRIKDSEDTKRLGLAGRVRQVFGSTTPSTAGVSVIGSPSADFAINVCFEEIDGDFWFSEDLVEMIDHGAGTAIDVDGRDAEWVRLADGEWQERPRSR